MDQKLDKLRFVAHFEQNCNKDADGAMWEYMGICQEVSHWHNCSPCLEVICDGRKAQLFPKRRGMLILCRPYHIICTSYNFN